MSKRIYLTTAIVIMALKIFATHVVRARRAPLAPATRMVKRHGRSANVRLRVLRPTGTD